MYSTSCPDKSGCLNLQKEENLNYLESEDWILQEPPKSSSEDCLSLRSYEYDQCPEFNDCDESVPDDNEFGSLASFEMIENQPNKIPIPSVSNSKSRRRGSDAMKELSVVLLNKLNRKFYSIRIGEWWKIKSQINPNKAVYLLGKKYFFNNANYSNLMGKKEFMLDFVSRFWFTYRENFKFLPCPNLSEEIVPDVLRSSDSGWGCMIRCGQMLMAQAMCMHFLGRSWNYTSPSPKEEAFHLQIIKWFGDFDKVTNPFSIHRIIRFSGYNPGQWFGPFSICNGLRDAFYNSRYLEPKLESLEVYFSLEQTIYRDEILDLMKRKTSDGESYSDSTSQSVIILLPLFLGSKSHTSALFTGILSKWLRDQCCLGIIGGKPQHAIYIFGCQEKNVIYLDPHFLQDTIDVNQDYFSVDTFHCKKPLVMPCSYLDPNCAVAFYCRDVNELNMFLSRLPKMCRICVKTNKGPVFRNLIDIQPGYSQTYGQ